ncbi:MAG TPA: hypothetical protein VG096_08680 [Bryobacteraceae bacterium]|nr:hypothetical protein [Bryobacteraceae bacterium]
MRIHSLSMIALMLWWSSTASAQAPAPRRDLSGVWALQPAHETSEDDHQSPGGEVPPMTSWAKARYDQEKPGYGKRAAPGGNDPILQCDPMGFPRILYFPAPFEFAQISNRVLQMFERDHVVREIWTDGRALPSDPDPLWYGYSVGKWVDDTTFVVESTGYDDRTWLGAAGFPHSETMRLEERYQRMDHDTINFTLTITDPQAYTKPWIALGRVLKLRPRAEIRQGYCVASEEQAFAKRIREPGALKTGAAPKN